MNKNRTDKHVKLIKSTHVERTSLALGELASVAAAKKMVGFVVAAVFEDGDVSCHTGGHCADNETVALKAAARLYHAMIYPA